MGEKEQRESNTETERHGIREGKKGRRWTEERQRKTEWIRREKKRERGRQKRMMADKGIEMTEKRERAIGWIRRE